jgi:hypothetical protein
VWIGEEIQALLWQDHLALGDRRFLCSQSTAVC